LFLVVSTSAIDCLERLIYEPGVTNWPVTMLGLVSHRWLCRLQGIGMWGYTPVGITGVLVSRLIDAASALMFICTELLAVFL